MANRKPTARHADFRVAGFLTKDEALQNDRNGQVMFQNFEHNLTGLTGLDALDQSNDFQDGDVFPIWVRVCKNTGYQAPSSRKVSVIRETGEGEQAEQPAEAADKDEIPF